MIIYLVFDDVEYVGEMLERCTLQHSLHTRKQKSLLEIVGISLSGRWK
jgi:hypothetical protein